MALIKHAGAAEMLRDAVVLDLGDLRRQADAIIRGAKDEAARVLEEARRERERLIADAHAEGLEAGRREGFAEGRAEGERAGRDEGLAARRSELDGLQAAWSAALDSFEAGRDRVSLEARSDVLELALTLAQRVTRRAVELDDDAVTGQLEAAIALVLKPTRLVVRVHPDDRARVADALPALASRFDAATHAQIEADPGAQRGSCVVCTDGGEIAAEVEAQIARLVEAVRPRRRVDAADDADGP